MTSQWDHETWTQEGQGSFFWGMWGCIWISWFSTVWNVFPKMVWTAASCFYLMCFAQSSLLFTNKTVGGTSRRHSIFQQKLICWGPECWGVGRLQSFFFCLGPFLSDGPIKMTHCRKKKVKDTPPYEAQSPKPETRGGWARLSLLPTPCTMR